MLQTRVIRVLLVDDDADVRTLLRFRLQDERFTIVGEATDGVIAVTLAEITKPDVIVLDIDMPVRDGLSSISELRRVAPASRIVVTSSGSIYAPVAMRVRALADVYIDKLDAVRALDETLVAMCGPDLATASGPTTPASRSAPPPA